MVRNLVFIIFLIKFFLFEKYEYEILFEKALSSTFFSDSSFSIPDLVSSWNLSFWVKVNMNSNNISTILDRFPLINFSNKNNISPLLTIDNIFLNMNTTLFFNQKFLIDLINYDPLVSIIEIENLQSNSNGWFFLSINYKFKKFSIYVDDKFILDIVSIEEYSKAQDSKINFLFHANIIAIFAHVHFFKFSLKEDDIVNEIKHYPHSVLAIYKFADYNSNTNFIMNSVNFFQYREVSVSNYNRIPFNDYNAFADVQIDLSFYNRSIVNRNLIICISGSIVFRNFIKDNISFQNIFWLIKWYTRSTEDNLNSLSFISQLYYSSITLADHIVNFQHLLSQNDLPNIFGNDTILRLGDAKRDDYLLNILTIIKIEDIPLPGGQTRSKIFKCEIPVLNYTKSLNYQLELGYYDKHYFKIIKNQSKPLLMYFILNEILIYTGNQVVKDPIENKIFLGLAKKVLVKCDDANDILRSYPDNNGKNILHKCIQNKSELKCPSFPNCILCISNECLVCQKHYQLINKTCLKCNPSQVLFKNLCQDSTISYQGNNIPNSRYSSYSTGTIYAVKSKFESLINTFDPSSVTNKYESMSFYSKDDLNNENPTNIFNLLNLNEFTPLVNFNVKEFATLNDVKSIQIDPYGCTTLKKYFTYDTNSYLKGICDTNCQSGLEIINLYCTKPLYFCATNDLNNINRCLKCNSNYKKFQNTHICSPNNIETNYLENTANIILGEIDVICTDPNCHLCSIDLSICYLCKINYTLLNNSCLKSSVVPTKNTIPSNSCSFNSVFIAMLDRCIICSSIINNCVDYDEGDLQYCKTCDENYILLKNEVPYYCLEKDNFVELCASYEKGPSNNCLECDLGYFLFEIIAIYGKKQICIDRIYDVNHCSNFDEYSFLCLECETPFLLVDQIENKKTCISANAQIRNCLIYEENLDCNLFDNSLTIKRNSLALCQKEKIFVGGKCVDICSEENINCYNCENTCSLYLCLRLIPFCIECDKNDHSKCNTCYENWVLDGGICKRDITSYEREKISCSDGCSVCLNNDCLTCKFDYFFDEVEKVCILDLKKITGIGNKNLVSICKEEMECMSKGIFYYQECDVCKNTCRCEIVYYLSIPHLECKDKSISFYNRQSIKPVFKDVVINFETKNSLSFKFKNNFLEETFIQIPQKIIGSSTNCSFDLSFFYKLKNKNYLGENLTTTTVILVKRVTEFIPIITNSFSAGLLSYLIVIYQMQEVFSYLYLVNFNGGRLFQIINSVDLDFFKFEDIVKERFVFEKELIFIREKYDCLHFVDFQDLSLMILYIVREISILLFVLIKTGYYFLKKGSIFYKDYFNEQIYSFKKRGLMSIYSLTMVYSIKNFSKANKFFVFHGLYPNIAIELAYIIFNFLLIYFSFYQLKKQFDFTFMEEEYEEIYYGHIFAIIDREEFRNQDFILNRILIVNYVVFFFRSFIMQNYFKFPIFVKVVFLITCLSLIYYFIKNFRNPNSIRIKLFISSLIINEFLFMIYFILGLDFLEIFIPLIVLDIFYCLCYLASLSQNIILFFLVYFLKKGGKLPDNVDEIKKQIIEDKKIKIILNPFEDFAPSSPNDSFSSRAEKQQKLKKGFLFPEFLSNKNKNKILNIRKQIRIKNQPKILCEKSNNREYEVDKEIDNKFSNEIFLPKAFNLRDLINKTKAKIALENSRQFQKHSHSKSKESEPENQSRYFNCDKRGKIPFSKDAESKEESKISISSEESVSEEKSKISSKESESVEKSKISISSEISVSEEEDIISPDVSESEEKSKISISSEESEYEEKFKKPKKNQVFRKEAEYGERMRRMIQSSTAVKEQIVSKLKPEQIVRIHKILRGNGN